MEKFRSLLLEIITLRKKRNRILKGFDFLGWFII